MKNAVERRKRSVALLVVGMMLGTFLLTPAGAHVGGSIRHLWTNHLLPMAKSTFYTKAQSDARYLAKSGRAADADLLDGQDAAAFAAADHGHDGSYAPPLAPERVLVQLAVPIAEAHLVTVDCTDGKKVISGGFNMNEPATIRGSFPLDEDTWGFRLRNDGPNNPTANLYAVCVAD